MAEARCARRSARARWRWRSPRMPATSASSRLSTGCASRHARVVARMLAWMSIASSIDLARRSGSMRAASSRCLRNATGIPTSAGSRRRSKVGAWVRPGWGAPSDVTAPPCPSRDADRTSRWVAPHPSWGRATNHAIVVSTRGRPRTSASARRRCHRSIARRSRRAPAGRAPRARAAPVRTGRPCAGGVGQHRPVVPLLHRQVAQVPNLLREPCHAPCHVAVRADREHEQQRTADDDRPQPWAP